MPKPAAGAGIDAWEHAAFEKLATAAMNVDGLHFVATYDHTAGVYRVIGHATDGEVVEIAYRREANPDGSQSFPVEQGDPTRLFASTDPDVYPSVGDLYAAFDNPNGVDLQDLGYAAQDPRVGFLPPAAQSYPFALERIAQLFDSPHAPDVVAGLFPWAYPGSGTHGELSVLQSRAALVLAGKGARAGLTMPHAARLVDVAPTVLAALGAPTTGGEGPAGAYDDGLYLKWQDGRVLWEALSPDPCDRASHAVVLLFDGLQATELAHLVLDADTGVEVPALRWIAERGAVFPLGAVAGFPSVSAPGHMTVGSGVWQGHHGVVANAFYLRSTREVINPFVIADDPQSVLSDPSILVDLYHKAVDPAVETLAKAAHRAFGPWDPETGEGAWVVVFDDLPMGGADFTTLQWVFGADFPGLQAAGPARNPKYDAVDEVGTVQVEKVVGDESNPVPTILELSFFSTDAAGQDAGPNSDLLRHTLEVLDARVQRILDVYEERGALDDTFFVLVADHGMELQDPSRAADLNGLMTGNDVRFLMPTPGMLYLRTLEIEVNGDNASAEVSVRDHDDGSPVAGATVTCPECGEPKVTDAQGRVTFDGLAGAPAAVHVEHPDYNPADWPL